MSYILSWNFFESLWHPAWINSILGIIIVTIIGMSVSFIATFSVLRQKPLAILQSS